MGRRDKVEKTERVSSTQDCRICGGPRHSGPCKQENMPGGGVVDNGSAGGGST